LGNYLFDVFQRMVAAFGKLQSKLREEICRRRGHRPARLDGQAAQATVAEEVMEYGKTENWQPRPAPQATCAPEQTPSGERPRRHNAAGASELRAAPR